MMNKTRKSVDKNVRKKQAKEIKKAQAAYAEAEEAPRTDKLKTAESLKKYPVKTKKSLKPLVEEVVKEMAIKKKKRKASVSKRTTPSELDLHESPRAYAHREGERWEKTIVKQNVGKGKALTAKIVKRASKTTTAKRKK
ncbi:MAG: hypothetical protein JSS30_06095 [Verrucomicrobia bacterium]|nr:hypothetical protein [Verrucomicrobiota bacterium]